MAMKYFDRKLRLSKDLEIDIWRESTMIESYGTSRYGLAFSAATRGYKVRVLSNITGYGFVNKLQPKIQGMNKKMLRAFFEERKKRCLRLGVKEERCTITRNSIRKCLLRRSPPLILTNARHFSGEDIPHWVVVTGFDENRFYVNNPLARHADGGLRSSMFGDVIGFKADQCAVCISEA